MKHTNPFRRALLSGTSIALAVSLLACSDSKGYWDRTVETCKGGIAIGQMKKELRSAGYDGPYNGTSEVEAFNRAACPGPERR